MRWRMQRLYPGPAIIGDLRLPVNRSESCVLGGIDGFSGCESKCLLQNLRFLSTIAPAVSFRAGPNCVSPGQLQ